MLVFGGVPYICNRHVKETSFLSVAFRVVAVSGVGIMTRSSTKTSVYKKIQENNSAGIYKDKSFVFCQN